MGNEEKIVKGFKGFDKNLQCKNFQYEIGKTYEHEDIILLCQSGFHFCRKLSDVYEYKNTDSRICEIGALGKVIDSDNKSVTNKIRIVRELSKDELNIGKDNTGVMNSGDRNSGNWNSGDRNSGNWNSGYRNSGNWNSGYRNSGNWNSGYSNSGDRNSGDRNSGDRNSGNWNSGYRNSGNWNSGNWNSSNQNSGFFNSTEPEKIRVFNKLISKKKWDRIIKPNFIYFELIEWIYSSDMTPEQKIQYPYHKTTDGFLKKYKYKEAWKNAWDKSDSEDRMLLFKLPNFEPKIFEEISGIDISESDEWKEFNKKEDEK